jgi:hypothetical protein
MNRLEIVSECCPNNKNINHIFGDDVMMFIDPKENELHTIKSNNDGIISIRNIDSYLDLMSEEEFANFISYLKTL